MSNTPVIGITLDHETKGEYSPFPFYALRENYFSSIAKSGGIPLALPYEETYCNDYINMIDGLVVTGGAFDVNPALYGDNTQHDTVVRKDKRTAFERAIMQKALDRSMPILGICGGEQLLNVILGGTLIQHIPDTIPNALEHEVKERTKPAHTIRISEGTLLHRVTGVTEMGVNSSHHQAVATPAPDVIINAVTEDGVVEGIEYTKHPFCLGVQWHPEYEVTPQDTAILSAFIQACRPA